MEGRWRQKVEEGNKWEISLTEPERDSFRLEGGNNRGNLIRAKMLVGPGKGDMHLVSHSQAEPQRGNKNNCESDLHRLLPGFHVLLAQKQPDDSSCVGQKLQKESRP